MAINDNNAQSFTSAAPQQQAAPQQMKGPDNTWSFSANSMFGAPIGRGVGSEYYNKLKENLANIFKQANENVQIYLIDMDNNNEPALAFSCLIVAAELKKVKESGIAYHIIVMEATGDKINPIYETINNQQVEILRYTSDAFDADLMAKAKERMQRAFPNGPWVNTGAIVIPANFNPEDKYSMHRLALNTGLANGTELEVMQPGFKDLNLATVVNENSLNINIQFNRRQIEDIVGNPMRSDFLVNFASVKKNAPRNLSVNAGGREQQISEVSGFIDLVWNPVNQPNPFGYYANPQAMTQTQKYVARMVITNLASNFSYTPSSILLALATSLSLRDDNNWIQTFKPTPVSGQDIDIADIGALNIEANLSNEPNGYGSRIDTKSESFKLEDLGQLIGAFVSPGLVVSMDCPEVTGQSWYMDLFAAAASGKAAAYDVLYDAAIRLTNGNIDKYFPRGKPMFTDPFNFVHLGYWTDRHGNKRDIRDIDHLAVCNLVGERNPSVIRDFSDTYLRTNYPVPLRMHHRKKIISSLTNETAVFTGRALRVTFTAEFLSGLSNGIRDTGLSVAVNTPMTSNDFNNQRGVASFAGSALMAPGQTFMSAASFGGQNQYMNQFNNFGISRF